MIENIDSIEIFSQIHESKLGKIEALFTSRSYAQNADVLRYGEPVDGLYVLVQGEVAVSIPGFERKLATLAKVNLSARCPFLIPKTLLQQRLR